MGSKEKGYTETYRQNRKRLKGVENERTVAGGEGIWEGQGHAAVFNMENLQGPAVQPRELWSTLCNNLVVTRGKDGEGTVRESGMDMDTQLYLSWRTSKDPLASSGKSAQCHVAAWMGGEFGGEGIHVRVWLSPLAVPQYRTFLVLKKKFKIKNSYCGSDSVS